MARTTATPTPTETPMIIFLPSLSVTFGGLVVEPDVFAAGIVDDAGVDVVVVDVVEVLVLPEINI